VRRTFASWTAASGERAMRSITDDAVVPEIFDLRPGGSLVEYLLGEGFDVLLVDGGVPDDQDAETGLDEYVCDELHWAIRETLRASDADELTLLGWRIGATLCAMYCGLDRGGEPTPVRNLALLTMPVDGRGSTYATWIGDEAFDAERVAERWRVVPGQGVDFANKLLKPVTNFSTTYRACGTASRPGPRVLIPTSRWPNGSRTTHRSPGARGSNGSA
jgi:polyhydroxyalkanoate synthase